MATITSKVGILQFLSDIYGSEIPESVKLSLPYNGGDVFVEETLLNQLSIEGLVEEKVVNGNGGSGTMFKSAKLSYPFTVYILEIKNLVEHITQ